MAINSRIWIVYEPFYDGGENEYFNKILGIFTNREEAAKHITLKSKTIETDLDKPIEIYL
ncbi:MAG: hypothetical protein AABY22_10580 [Nanoarchaeota archaeon]